MYEIIKITDIQLRRFAEELSACKIGGVEFDTLFLDNAQEIADWMRKQYGQERDWTYPLDFKRWKNWEELLNEANYDEIEQPILNYIKTAPNLSEMPSVNITFVSYALKSFRSCQVEHGFTKLGIDSAGLAALIAMKVRYAPQTQRTTVAMGTVIKVKGVEMVPVYWRDLLNKPCLKLTRRKTQWFDCLDYEADKVDFLGSRPKIE